MAVKQAHKDGKVGGVLVGRKHRDGGIKIKNVSTGEPIEAESGEVIIMADAVSDRTRHEFNGRKMTNLEILSAINEGAGGVALYKEGGKIDGPVKCGCSGKHHIYNGEKLSDREILKKMSEGGVISREIKSANDFELLTPEELLVLESYKQFKPAFRKKNIAQAFSDSGYPHHEHLEKAEALIEQLKKFGFITPQNALSEQGKLAVQKANQKWGIAQLPALPHNKNTYNRWWLSRFEGDKMAKGGNVIDAQAQRAKKADLIILPESVQGTNCSNCQFVQITDKGAGQGYCKHPEVDQPVTARMCCIFWDAPGTERVLQHTGKILQHGGAIGLNSASDILNFQTGMNPRPALRVSGADSREKFASGGQLKGWHDEKSFYYNEAKPEVINRAGMSVIVEEGDVAFLMDEFLQNPTPEQAIQWMKNVDNLYYIDRVLSKGDEDIAVIRNEHTGKSHYKNLQELSVLLSSEQKFFFPDTAFLDQIYGKDNRFAKGGKIELPAESSTATISEIAKADDRILIVRPSHGQSPEEAEPQNIQQASTKTAKQQAAINQEIVNLVKKKGTNSVEYSASEIALIKQYSGAGGLSKHGASGPRILDQFFTPMDICSKMWGLALEHGFNFNKTAILEPSVGTGNFLQFIPRDAQVEVVGYELDDISHSICKILFPQYDIRHGSFESMFFTGKRHIGLAGVTTFFDLVIGNPPYREYVSPYAKLGERDATGAFTFEMYFMMRGIDVLKPGGLLVFVIPNTFMSNDKKYNEFKEMLWKKADLVIAYRLVNGFFDFTDVGTDIIVLRKR